eukprot:Rmarinus@m.3503
MAIHIKERLMLSRLLYTNPVCILTVKNDVSENAMTISWLTPINNKGFFIASMNQRRHTATLIGTTDYFVLNVPVRGMEETVRRIGGCHGNLSKNKLEDLAVETCKPGWDDTWLQKLLREFESDPPSRKRLQRMQAYQENFDDTMKCVAVKQCVAHLMCRVHRKAEDDGHWLLTCSIDFAFVLPSYWNGKHFGPVSEDYPPYLTFLGAGRFGYVLPAAENMVDRSRGGGEGSVKDNCSEAGGVKGNGSEADVVSDDVV